MYESFFALMKDNNLLFCLYSLLVKIN